MLGSELGLVALAAVVEAANIIAEPSSADTNIAI